MAQVTIELALERQQASRLFEVAEPGERPIELHDAEGIATPLNPGGLTAEQSEHVEV